MRMVFPNPIPSRLGSLSIQTTGGVRVETMTFGKLRTQEEEMKGWKRKLGFVSAALSLTFIFMTASALIAEIKQIKSGTVKNMIDSKKSDFVIVDTQSKEAYDLGHIRGAINFPWSPDLKNSGGLPKNKTLILYYDCTHEEDSTDLANQLRGKFRYQNIKILEGGWLKWQQLGYPIDKK